MVASVTSIMLRAPRQGHGEVLQNTASVLPMFLRLLSEACLKTALASWQASFLLTMKLAAAATLKLMSELQRHRRGEKWASIAVVDASLKPLAMKESISTPIKVVLESSVACINLSAPYLCHAEIRCFAFTTIKNYALQYFQPEVGKHADGCTQSTNRLTAAASGQPTIKSVAAFLLEEGNPETCRVGSDDRFILGPDMDAILRSKEPAEWLATAKISDDDDEDEDEDEDDDEDEAEAEAEDDADGEVGEEGEGEEHEEPDDDEDEGGEDDEGDGDEDEDDEEDGNGDDDDEDDDEDDDDEEESPEPPKKKKK